MYKAQLDGEKNKKLNDVFVKLDVNQSFVRQWVHHVEWTLCQQSLRLCRIHSGATRELSTLHSSAARHFRPTTHTVHGDLQRPANSDSTCHWYGGTSVEQLNHSRSLTGLSSEQGTPELTAQLNLSNAIQRYNGLVMQFSSTILNKYIIMLGSVTLYTLPM